MILGAHNGHAISLDGPPVPPDPGIGIVGSGGANRWNGDAQAYVDSDTTEVVRGNQRILIEDTILDLPANFPVTPEANDILTVRYLDGSVETFKVRMIDRGLLPTGRMRVRCRAD